MAGRFSMNCFKTKDQNVGQCDRKKSKPVGSRVVYRKAGKQKSDAHIISVSLDEEIDIMGQNNDHMLEAVSDIELGNRSPDLSSEPHVSSLLPIPGIVGLKNHGNTCFMNAVVQCLNGNEVFAKYFITDEYKRDFRPTGKDSYHFGTNRDLPHQFASLLKGIRFCDYSPELTENLKNTLEKYGFHRGEGEHQQDAQEFLIWLLNKIHEDLNCSLKRKCMPKKKSFAKSDSILAEESPANHFQCNDSFIHGLFQARYKSSVQCPDCYHRDVTFDPFLCVSLPLPQRSTRFFSLVVVFLHRVPQMTKIGLSLEASLTIADLRESIAKLCLIAVTHIVLTEIYFDGFHRSFIDDQPLSTVRDGDPVYAIETPLNFNKFLTPTSMAPYLHVHCNGLVQDRVVLILLNKDRFGREGLRFGKPVVLEVPRQLTYTQLQSLILKGLGYQPVDIPFKMDSIFRLCIISGAGGKSYLSPEDMKPLYSAAIDRLIQSSGEEGGPCHIKMLVEWEIDLGNCLFPTLFDNSIAEDDSLYQERLLQQQPLRISLLECFELYANKEQHDTEEWLCPQCKKLKNDTIKRTSLWSTSDILVLHLKRFKRDGVERLKNQTLVDFPLYNLNINSHLEKQSTRRSSRFLHASFRQNRGYKQHCNNDHSYHLFAVCNHSDNSSSGGHYTAFCKDPINQQWYFFDDMKVEPISEQDIVTQSAYLLFYQKA